MRRRWSERKKRRTLKKGGNSAFFHQKAALDVDECPAQKGKFFPSGSGKGKKGYGDRERDHERLNFREKKGLNSPQATEEGVLEGPQSPIIEAGGRKLLSVWYDKETGNKILIC